MCIPQLPSSAQSGFYGSKTRKQLVQNTKYFFANPENFRHDVARKKFLVSSILKWFAEDFGSDQAAQLGKIAPYSPTEAAQAAAKSNSVSVAYLDYDWSLNEQKSEVQAQAGSDRSRDNSGLVLGRGAEHTGLG